MVAQLITKLSYRILVLSYQQTRLPPPCASPYAGCPEQTRNASRLYGGQAMAGKQGDGALTQPAVAISRRGKTDAHVAPARKQTAGEGHRQWRMRSHHILRVGRCRVWAASRWQRAQPRTPLRIARGRVWASVAITPWRRATPDRARARVGEQLRDARAVRLDHPRVCGRRIRTGRPHTMPYLGAPTQTCARWPSTLASPKSAAWQSRR